MSVAFNKDFRNMGKYMLSKTRDKILGTSQIYDQPSWGCMITSSTYYASFKNHGGEHIIFHGLSDLTFSVIDTINLIALRTLSSNS